MDIKFETRKVLWLWSGLLCCVVLCFWVVVFVLNSSVYSPGRLVAKYFVSLSAGDLGQALSVLNSTVPQGDASLLSGEVVAAAVGEVRDVRVVELEKLPNNVFLATVSVVLGGEEVVSKFSLQRNENFFFLFHDWGFASRSLPVLNVNVTNGSEVDVNGVSVVLPGGSGVFPVVYPGFYEIFFRDDFFETDVDRVAVLGDVSGGSVRVVLEKRIGSSLQADLQAQLEGFLDVCVASKVLAPTGCPFYYFTDNRIVGDPVWEVVSYPQVVVESFGGSWVVANMGGRVRVSGSAANIFTGEVDSFSEGVDFVMGGSLVFGESEVKFVPEIKY